jgi:hypothetical protein
MKPSCHLTHDEVLMGRLEERRLLDYVTVAALEAGIDDMHLLVPASLLELVDKVLAETKAKCAVAGRRYGT